MCTVPFKDQFEHVSHTLDCVHIDLVGHITPPSVSGFCYFSTIEDQATSYKIIQLLKHKSDAFDQFVIVKKEMEMLHDWLLKKLVSDCGGELLNEKFQKPLETHGFIHVNSNLPNTSWADAINTSTALFNLVPTPSRAVVLIPKHHRDWKLGPVGAEGIIIGYENDNSSYRILCLSDKKILISRHAKFDETVFPTLKKNPQPHDQSALEWGNQPSRTEMVDSVHPVRTELVDKPQPEEPSVIPEEAQEMLDEPLSSSDESLEDFSQDPPVINSCLRVIGPRHPTIYLADISKSNILPFGQRLRVLVTSVDDCPRTYKKELVSANRALWASAIRKELQSMNDLKVWDIFYLNPDYKLVRTTWVFRIKCNHLNKIVKHKARLCAQGFTQTLGLDFDITYAPTG
ncbi:hypothetical protein O181_044022 [Austropuccinia psidii MF-1]|uniref:Reverse transcriptase Ty1/copia-type domain-containing protein n=1 Tax=Austropuccinia psidii MF-1 TaxID=1389203 RepID=A0A9Q3DLP1_9BASI|nr:hypothetical protein [Austropuccinia psidii MF-1]